MWFLVVHQGILKPTAMNSNSQSSNKKLILLLQVIKTSISLCILESSYISVEIVQRIHQCTLKFEKQEKRKLKKTFNQILFRYKQNSSVSLFTHRGVLSRCSIVVSIPACHAGDPGSIPGSGALSSSEVFFLPCMGSQQRKECCCKRAFVCSR